jgi:hypothetical protein
MQLGVLAFKDHCPMWNDVYCLIYVMQKYLRITCLFVLFKLWSVGVFVLLKLWTLPYFSCSNYNHFLICVAQIMNTSLFLLFKLWTLPYLCCSNYDQFLMQVGQICQSDDHFSAVAEKKVCFLCRFSLPWQFTLTFSGCMLYSITKKLEWSTPLHKSYNLGYKITPLQQT